MRKIQSKFTPLLLAPANAFDKEVFGVYETLDGEQVEIRLHSALNNDGGYFDDFLEDFCQEHYKCSFDAIKSIWLGRLGYCDKYWHIVDMVK